MGKLFIANPAAPRGGPATASPEDFGSAEGEGLGALGQAVGTTAQMISAVERSRARTAAAAYSADMQLAEQNITADTNDIANWDQRLQQASDVLKRQHGSGNFIHQGTFQEAAKRRESERTVSLASAKHAAILRAGEASYKENIRSHAADYANTLDPERRQDVLNKIEIEVDLAVEEGLRFPEARNTEIQDALAIAVAGAVDLVVDKDPDHAADILKQHGHLLEPKLEAQLVRQMWTARDSSISRELRMQDAQATRDARELKDRQRGNAAYLASLARRAEGSVGLQQSDLDEVMASGLDALSKEDLIWAEKIVQDGGFITSAAPNPQKSREFYQGIYNDTIWRSLGYDTFESYAFTFYRDGHVSHEIYTKAVEEQRENRIKPSMTMLKNVVEILTKYNPAEAIAVADAQGELLEWFNRQENQGASPADVRAYATEMAKRHDFRGALDREPTKMPSYWVRKKDGKLDMVDARKTWDRLVATNQLGEHERANDLKMIQAEEMRQQRLAELEAARGE